MSDNVDKDGLLSLAQRLIKETGISESEAADLISVLGTNWPSLVREAKAISKRRVAPQRLGSVGPS